MANDQDAQKTDINSPLEGDNTVGEIIDTDHSNSNDEITPQDSPDISKDVKETFNVGDTIVVGTKITEDSGVRVQKYEGIVIGIKGSGSGKTFTVRRIGANEIGIERIFPYESPNVVSIIVKKKGKIRRSKLYYLRERKGKAGRTVKFKA